MEARAVSASISLRAAERQLRDQERDLCARALAETQSITGAAEALGIDRRTFLGRVIRCKITVSNCGTAR